jgi:methionyl-tRNA formyltransferase
MNGDKKTGITIMYMDIGMDTGDIIEKEEIEITDTDTVSILHDKLSILGSKLLIKTLPSILNGTNNRTPQDDTNATYAKIIKPEDEKLDFNKSTIQIYNQIRGLNSFPGAYFILDGKRYKVFESIIGNESFYENVNGEVVKLYKEGIGIKTSNGVIILTVIQPEGKSKMNARDFLNGQKESLVGKIIS